MEARRRGLHSDASHRFERSVATDLQRRAMERATALLLGIVGGRAGPVVDECREDHLPEPARIALRASRIRRLLGIDLSPADVEGILTRLGMRLEETAKGEWRVVVPPSRPDVTIEADLIEELARVHGYDRIPDRSPAADLRMRPSAEAGSGVGGRARGAGFARIPGSGDLQLRQRAVAGGDESRRGGDSAWPTRYLRRWR